MILELLKTTCNALNIAKINYMISGSVASNIYTIPRMTRDIDIVFEIDEKMVADFIALFPNHYLNKETIRTEVHKKGMFNIIDHSTGFKIDFILRKDTEYFKLAFNRRRIIQEFGTTIYVISIEDLILAKLIWSQSSQSEKQLDDIQNLLLNPEKDMKYIHHWVMQLQLNTFNLI